MTGLLFEGLESALLPCSLILIMPGLGVAGASHQRFTGALLAYATSVGIASWLRFSGYLDTLPTLVIAALLAAAVVSFLLRPSQPAAIAGGVLSGSATASLWAPCVGSDFGNLLGDLSSRGGTGLVLFLVYVIGVLSPLAILGAGLTLTPRSERVRKLLAGVGRGLLALLAIATAVGWHDELVSQLVQMST
ncbi:MAG: hypothetical protein HKN03_09695 [Acidimicrobiales bacterium]|nr:hypothetical protein [Acidimicrobiales bacterium]